jgi:peptidoglycan/LPS O-acetylase OafA/YrhL
VSGAVEHPAPKRSALSRWLELDLLDNRYPALHGMRVVAILSVIQFHVTWVFAGEQGIKLDQDFVTHSLTLFFGMDLFFFLSGFLIGSILLRSLAVQGTQNIRRFYIRRVFRTFPSYYVVLTFLALTTLLTDRQRAHLVYEYVYATNFMPLGRGDVIMFWGWSLSLEEQFYLTVPILFFLLHRMRSDRARLVFLTIFWAGALAMRLYIFFRYGPWTDLALYGALYFHTHTRYDTLVAGIVLAFVHARYKEDIARWLAHPFHRALVLLPSLGCLWLLVEPWVFGQGNVQLVHVFAWGTITSVMYFSWVLLVIHSPSFVTRALSTPFWRRVATLGYGVYLVHIPILDLIVVPAAHSLDAHGVPMLIVWPASLVFVSASSLALAYGLHVLIEKPSLRIREWLAA